MSAIERLIEAAGDPKGLADVLTNARPAAPITRDDVYNWRRRGRVPAHVLPALRRSMRRLRCPEVLPELELQATRRKARPAPADGFPATPAHVLA